MESLRITIMSRDNIGPDVFEEMVQEAMDMIDDMEDPEDVLQDVFGVEPDYYFDLFHEISLLKRSKHTVISSDRTCL